jgi:outer membrane receptor protein involved in Fe transport
MRCQRRARRGPLLTNSSCESLNKTPPKRILHVHLFEIRLTALLLFVLSLYGQTPASEIHLEVKDSSGTPMQALGKLQPMPTGSNRIFQTDTQGTFTFANLPYGRYQLEVANPGFTTRSLPIDVKSAAPVMLTVTMTPAAQATKVDVIATTPLPGVDLPINQIPAPVQTANQADVEKSSALDLADFMNRRLNGVYMNEMQGNPFQPDLNYRGYTASPLLGTPQGMSIYMDGVRQNQPFGDVVSWDLIPRNAISEITLMSGSNPVFGLNTLGGALSIQTKDGVTNPGLSGNVMWGSSGRKELQAEAGGGKPTGFNWFLAANAFHESGWRVDSPSDVRQGFGRFGWRTASTDLALTATYAYNTLTGNGIQDYRLLANNYSSVYTIPDTTGNRSPSLNFRAQHSISSTLTFSGNAWYRNIRTEGINGNANGDSFDQSVYQPTAADIAALKAAGFSGYPVSGANAANTPFPYWRCIAQTLEHSQPNQKCDGIIFYSKEVQNEFGFSGQMTLVAAPGGRRNQFTAGAVFDRAAVDFTQNTQYGYINPNKTITGVSAWDDDSGVNLHGVTPNWSLFATDTLSLGKAWNLTLSGRYNRNIVHNTDRLTPGGGPGSLDANDVFGRFNSSIGVTYNPTQILNVYASYAQGSRAPTSIELGCADPNDPCTLPNALASDPPLKQVVTGTWEAGLRGKTESNISWNFGAFRSENQDDILFVASKQSGAGYFKNFGKTRRQGIQAGINARIRRVTGGLDYTLLDATYQSTETVNGTGNNTSDNALAGLPGTGGTITIRPGNQIPLIPRNTGKIFADIQATSKLEFDLALVATSSSYARGNENNQYKADGKYYLGPGVSPGYAVANLGAHYDLTRRLQFVAQIDNLFDRHYYTAAQLATTGFTAQGTFIARPFPANANGDFPLQSATFFSPGAPRRAWIGLRLRW